MHPHRKLLHQLLSWYPVQYCDKPIIGFGLVWLPHLTPRQAGLNGVSRTAPDSEKAKRSQMPAVQLVGLLVLMRRYVEKPQLYHNQHKGFPSPIAPVGAPWGRHLQLLF